MRAAMVRVGRVLREGAEREDGSRETAFGCLAWTAGLIVLAYPVMCGFVLLEPLR